MRYTEKDVKKMKDKVAAGAKKEGSNRKPRKRKEVIYINTKYPYSGNVPTNEHELQSYCHSWRMEYYPDVTTYSVPNGAYFAGRTIIDENGKKIRISKEAEKQLAEGLTKGVADYFVAVLSHNEKGGIYGGLYIEFKFRDGTQSPEQIEFQKSVEKEGYKYVIVKENETVLNERNAIDPLYYFKKEFRAYLDRRIVL